MDGEAMLNLRNVLTALSFISGGIAVVSTILRFMMDSEEKLMLLKR